MPGRACAQLLRPRACERRRPNTAHPTLSQELFSPPEGAAPAHVGSDGWGQPGSARRGLGTLGRACASTEMKHGRN